MDDAEFFKNWINSISDFNSLKVLLFLKESNPNVSLEYMEKNLNIERSELIKTLSKLFDVRMVKQENNSYRLTHSGRIAVNKLETL